MTKHPLAVVALALCLLASGMGMAGAAEPATEGTASPTADAVLHWSEVTADAAIVSGITPIFDPLDESRLYAMVHIAIHDALNAIHRRYQPYALHIGVWPDASPEAAVAAAAHDTLVSGLNQLPPELEPDVEGAVAVVEEAYAEALAAIPEGTPKGHGIAVGQAAAAAIIAIRYDDGHDTVFLDFDYLANKYPVEEFPEGTPPGIFRHVQDAPFAASPEWGEVDPFVMAYGAQFRPGPPYPVRSAEYAADFNELKDLGALEGSSRTEEQTEIAFFWFEASPLRWNRIARTVTEAAGLDLWQAGRLFALLNMALADGYIGNWDAKYHYDAWRTETAVRLADTDGNPDTEGDPDWTPLWGSSGATPEHDSGHAIEGAAAATVMRRVLGTDQMSFSVCSYTLAAGTCTDESPTLRTYSSFSEAARENAESRILIGWHFRKAIEDGLEHGDKIGHRAVNNYLLPVG
jgi:hypothetical protein